MIDSDPDSWLVATTTGDSGSDSDSDSDSAPLVLTLLSDRYKETDLLYKG